MSENTVPNENTPPEAADEASVTLERPVRHIRQPYIHKNARLLLLCLTALAGTALGAVTAPEGIVCVLTGHGSFFECLLARLLCSGTALVFVYIAGLFAAGGMIVWLAPLFSGLGMGLSVSCVFAAGFSEGLWLIPLAAAYPLLTVFAANTSANLSELIAHFITSKKSSIIMSESAMREYTLKFFAYLMILLALSAAEAAIKL
ncbi:MAG: hypothetical protein ACI4KM_09490 [Oscillospiraceae bacterium]